MRGTPQLGPQAREDAWKALDGGSFDVLVVGGGVTGCGVALDAATRGLSVALVEARDIGSGTSSRSSKLFHGGLRYLEQMDFALVREALKERDLALTRLAPHLVRPVSFLYPLTRHGWERGYVGAGLALYDAMGGSRALPRHKHLTRRGARALAPALRGDALIGGIRYYDAQCDDARYTLTLARTAAAYGATVRSSTEVVGFVREGGRIVGAELRDTARDYGWAAPDSETPRDFADRLAIVMGAERERIDGFRSDVEASAFAPPGRGAPTVRELRAMRRAIGRAAAPRDRWRAVFLPGSLVTRFRWDPEA